MTIQSEITAIIDLIEKYSSEIATGLQTPYGGLILMALKHLFGITAGDATGLVTALTEAQDIATTISPIVKQVAAIEPAASAVAIGGTK